ncbi:unnamed protein product [Closterium sp. Naga37s-1]|nr:unnamed protein product [Closterium sp. Naga37s-1]
MLGLKGQAEEPPQALSHSSTDNTLLVLGQLGIPQHEVPRLQTGMQLLQRRNYVRRAEALETGLEAEGNERQGRDGEEPKDAADEEAQPKEPLPEEAANGQEAREVPHPHAPSGEEPEEEARKMTAPRVTPLGQEGVATPRETTPQDRR